MRRGVIRRLRPCRRSSGHRSRSPGAVILAGLCLLPLVASLSGCATSTPVSISAGESRKQLLAERVGLFRRSYRLHVPAGFDPTDPTPRLLVVALHGGVARGAIFERQSGFSELADREGFFVVYPNGIGFFGLFRHWNGGWCCASALRRDLDDVAFVDRVVDHVAARYPVDTENLIVVGYSNGGMLAYLYAARRSERVAGLGVFASSPGLENADGEPIWLPPVQESPVPAFIVHGAADPRLPVDGSRGDEEGRGTFAARGAAELWKERNGCHSDVLLEKLTGMEGVESLFWCQSRREEVGLEILAGWGHDWPSFSATSGPDAPPGLERYDAARRMWLELRP